ncbi:MAG: cytochrome c, partial [Magnetococcales bacterium]|nr:cytochrome c [Magnetococcales bacterium]
MSRQFFTLLILFSALVSFSPVTGQAEENPGKSLHDESCNSCHASRFGGNPDEIYTRSNRKKKDFDQLHSMVAFCNQQTGTGWFDDEVDQVT